MLGALVRAQVLKAQEGVQCLAVRSEQEECKLALDLSVIYNYG